MVIPQPLDQMLQDVQQSWKFCEGTEWRSLWLPAELAPFFSQHHKWSWSRPEQRTVRLPLCADSIRNNCILASLHSSPPLPPQSDTLLYFCAVSCSTDPELEKETAALLLLLHFNIHITLDSVVSCIYQRLKTSTHIKIEQTAVQPPLSSSTYQATHFKC